MNFTLIDVATILCEIQTPRMYYSGRLPKKMTSNVP